VNLVEGYARVPEDTWYYVLHPRPVYVIAAGSKEKANFMAASWVSPFSEDPPRVIASLDKTSYTAELVKRYRVFTINVYHADAVDFVYGAGTVSGRRVDKAKLLGAELAFDTETGAPRIAKPRPLGVVEAKVFRILEDLAEDVDLVVADVVAAYADPNVFNQNYGWVLQKARILLHASGRGFTTATQLIVARRGRSS
jgi:flavin reductase (DIM6/NTAB) family NADH-FMN oxidoreductase RutF